MIPKEFMVRLFLSLDSLHIINPGSWRSEPIRGPWILPTILPMGPASASQWKAKHKVPLTATSAKPGSVRWAGTEVGSKERLRPLGPGTLGSRELRRQTQARETEARAAPADWSKTRPIRVQGRCWRRHTRALYHAGAPANQSLASVQRLTNRKPPWRNKGALALQDQVPEDLNTWFFLVNG